jgi:hypothetical protein
MKFYAIPPNKHLNLTHEGDSYFVLAHHYVLDKNYKNFFLNLKETKPSAFITLDNSAAEHSLVTEEVLLDVVKELKPNEVIAPDVLFNRDQTLMNLRSFKIKMRDLGLLEHTKIFGCPQGSNKEEWLTCYYKMANDPFVSTIGLSKIAVPKCWNDATGDTMIAKSRNECVKHLYEKGWLIKPLHLLGMGEHDEFEYYLANNIPHIRSSDSCYTILAAINGIDFERGDTTRIPTTNAYFDVELTSEQIDLAKKNINYLKTKYSAI